jgi:transcriptional regulator NrdR family protein
MMPMRCPKCCSGAIRVPITNNKLDDQVVRKRICADCGHKWFTVEVAVPDYAVGWSAEHLRKPVLRAPVTVKATHQEPKDRLAALREASERRSMEADLRHRVAKCD